MGDIRIGTLPDTRPWRRVVELLADGSGVAQIAAATTLAAKRGMDLAETDPGLCQAVCLMTNIVLASRQPEFCKALQAVGMQVPEHPTLFELIGGFSDAFDKHFVETGGRTDIGEMAQLAAVSTLAAQIGTRHGESLGPNPGDCQRQLQELLHIAAFVDFTCEFFSRFMHRFLIYHLGRELSNHVGGNGRFATLDEHTEFDKQLALYCRETAGQLRELSGRWYQDECNPVKVSPKEAEKLVKDSLAKLRRLFRIRGDRGG